MSIRNEYKKIGGVDKFYATNQSTYRNPHNVSVIKCLDKLEQMHSIGRSVLDLCCGDGIVTKHLSINHSLTGCDPYLSDRYVLENNCHCYKFSFLDISKGELDKLGVHFDCVIVSYALHLCRDSLLHQVCYRLSLVSSRLITISPSKKLDIDEIYPWRKTFEDKICDSVVKVYDAS